jgi:hypothetical protein
MGTQAINLVEGRWQLALPEDNRRFVVILTHFRVDRWMKGNDAHFAQIQSQAIGASALRLLSRPALNAWTK